jgi:preprotein translocase subunit SecA
MEEDEPIEHGMVTRAIERAQKQVEAQNFSIRKHLLEYDDVMNKQRQAFYDLRRDVLRGDSQRDYIREVAAGLLDDILAENGGDREPPEWDWNGLGTALLNQFGIDLGERAAELKAEPRPAAVDALQQLVKDKYERKEAELEALAPGMMRRWELDLVLYVADSAWRDHLYALDHLKEGIGLRGYAQKDPLVEYKRESFDLFEGMWSRIEEEIVRRIYLFRPVVEPAPAPRPVARRELSLAGAAVRGGGAAGTRAAAAGAPMVAAKGVPKVGRNEPCPCGSGKKYKKCHGGEA